MIHPIFMAALRHPELLFKHFGNYAELVKNEGSAAALSLAIRAASAMAASVALIVALGLTGIAVMLGALQGDFHWVLVIVPGMAWLLVLFGVLLAMRPTLKREVEHVHSELDADLTMLRLVRESGSE